MDNLIKHGVVTVGSDGKVRLTRDAWRMATQDGPYADKFCVHFVGFKDDRYWNAVHVFGRPDFVHRFWDVRATHEVADGDVVVFADGDDTQPVRKYAYDDSAHF